LPAPDRRQQQSDLHLKSVPAALPLPLRDASSPEMALFFNDPGGSG